MTPASSDALPAWVKKRDGRVVPFEADCITQALFAATKSLGQPDAFLARELTDGVLHFLAADAGESIPSTADIAELVVKVVRELRHPQLARAFAQRQQAPPRHGAGLFTMPFSAETAPTEVVAQALRGYSLQAIFSPDLAAAHQSGLLELSGLEAPHHLAAGVLGPATNAVVEAVVDARETFAGWLAVDSPDDATLPAEAAAFVAQLTLACRATGLAARLQLNAEPPPWVLEGAEGPLFAGPAPSPGAKGARSAALVDAWLDAGSPSLSLDWHLSDRDGDRESVTLLRLARAALEGRPATFVFDRPRRLVSLGPGLDRKQTALLMTVGLPLPRLLDHTGITDDVELFLRKLGSLARWTVSAAVQKRQFIRQRHPHGAALSRGFLLDRARILVACLGLETAVRRLTGAGLCDGKTSLDVGRRILQHLHEVLQVEGRRRLVDSVLDAPGELAGAATTPEQQLRAAGRLHAVCGTGTAVLLLPEEERTTPEQMVRLLQYTWQRTEVQRLRLVRRRQQEDQPSLPIT
jgi:hypothetical protein